MPTAYVKKMAKKHGMSIGKAEKEWAAAKKIARKQYGDSDAMWPVTTTIFKNKMKARKSESRIYSFSEFVNESKKHNNMLETFDDGSDNFFIQNLIDEYSLDIEDAMSLCELHNIILKESDFDKKREMINHMFTKIGICGEEWHDLRNLIRSWCMVDMNTVEMVVQNITVDGMLVTKNGMDYFLTAEDDTELEVAEFIIDEKPFYKMIKPLDKIKIYYGDKDIHEQDIKYYGVTGISINNKFYISIIDTDEQNAKTFISLKKI